MKGVGYEVKGEKELRLKHAEHVKSMAPILTVIKIRYHFRFILIVYQKWDKIIIYLCGRSSIQVEKYWDFENQRDLNKIICTMKISKVAICDLKTVQPSMNAADREVMTTHMGKPFSVGWLNDEVCGKGNEYFKQGKLAFCCSEY